MPPPEKAPPPGQLPLRRPHAVLTVRLNVGRNNKMILEHTESANSKHTESANSAKAVSLSPRGELPYLIKPLQRRRMVNENISEKKKIGISLVLGLRKVKITDPHPVPDQSLLEGHPCPQCSIVTAFVSYPAHRHHINNEH